MESLAVTPASNLSLLAHHRAIFACPLCGGELVFETKTIACAGCSRVFKQDHDIPLLFCGEEALGKGDVTDIVRSFYEETPFPNYEDIDSKWRLIEKAERSLFADLLNKQIRYNVKILDAGCGTGQLANYLGIASGRTVFAADMSLNSLKLAIAFKYKCNIENTAFLQMNLFRPVFKPETFDMVISNGVLHHTSDPYAAFRSLLRLVKKEGFIAVGLYNKYGRIPRDLRRLIFRLTGDRFHSLDPRLRQDTTELRKHTWFADQYLNPHESRHTMDEVLRWFNRNGVEFINSIPKPSPFGSFSENEKLFKKNPVETRLERLLVQLGMCLSGAKEGGLFIMIGRKEK